MKNNRWILGLVLAAIIAGLFYALISNGTASHNWSRTLQKDGKEPYDLFVFYKALKHTYGANYFESGIADSAGSITKKLEAIDSAGTYFFAGGSAYLTDNDSKAISDFVFAGGNAFFISESIPQSLLTRIEGVNHINVRSALKDSIGISFTNLNLEKTEFLFTYKQNTERVAGEWHYLVQNYPAIPENESNSHTHAWKKYAVKEDYVIVSNIENEWPDFITVNYGRGKLYLHVNPVLLGNYYLQTQEGIEYAATVIKHIPGKTIYAHLGAAYPRPESQTGYSERSVFAFIKQNQSLWYAWWILLAGAGLFLLTGGRRKQRAIPVMAAPANHTLALIENIGYFYFREKNHALVYQKEWTQFQNFVRLHVRMTLDHNPETWLRLAERAGVNSNATLDIFKNHQHFGAFSELSADELIECNKSFTQFYQEYFKSNGK